MRPLTDYTAKPLIVAGANSLIEYHLQNLQRAGIRDVVINTCWHADKIVNKLGNGSDYGVQIRYSHEDTALETAGGIANALPLLGDKTFLVISADTWTDFEITDLVSSNPTSRAHLLLVDNPPHNPTGDFALKGEYLAPRDDSNTYTYSGIGLYHPALFKELAQESVPLRDVLKPAIKQGLVSGQIHNGRWSDIGTVARLEELRSYLDTAGASNTVSRNTDQR